MDGNNLNDECYVELLLGALTKKEKAELVKAQVDRMTEGVNEEDESVLVNYEPEGAFYPAVIKRVARTTPSTSSTQRPMTTWKNA